VNPVYRFSGYRQGARFVSKKRAGRERKVSLPCRIATRVGAQVAPQRCLTLRTSGPILAQAEVVDFLILIWVTF
jgi:hypothetical protein